MDRKWLTAISGKLANFYSTIVLAIIYLFLIPIFALIYSLLGPRRRYGWVKWPHTSKNLAELRRHF